MSEGIGKEIGVALGAAVGPIAQNAVATLSKNLPPNLAKEIRQLLDGAEFTFKVKLPPETKTDA